MARFLGLWRINPIAPWPTDPSESLKLNEKMWAAMDALIKNGEVEEFGWFVDGNSGYAITVGDTADAFRRVNMYYPYMLVEVHEIIPYEKGKAILRAVNKAKAEVAQ